MEYCLINCTAPSFLEAKNIAKHLVETKLIACCSIIPKVTSIYIWENNLHEDNEVLMIMKTKVNLFEKIEAQIKKLHSYDVPEIICIPISNGSLEYLNWINDQTNVFF